MPLSTKKASRWVRKMQMPFYQHITDPRDQRGKRHGLGGMLNLLVTAMCTLKLGLRDAEALSEDLPIKMNRRLGLSAPVSDTALYEVVSRLSPDEFRGVVQKRVHADLAAKVVTNDLFARGVAAFDGKGCGSGMGEASQPLLRSSVCDAQGTKMWDAFAMRVALVSSSACPILDQEYISRKRNEMSTFSVMFPRVCHAFPRLFRYVTVDAGYTSQENATLIREFGKHYVAALKPNFSVLFPRAQKLLADAPCVASTTERAGGKEVRRELRRVAVPADVKFPGATQFWGVRITRTQDREVTSEDRIFVVSIPDGELAPDSCLAMVRLHWSIENIANWTCDMLLNEDTQTPCTAGNGVLVLGWLRVIAYNVLAAVRARLRHKDKKPQPWKRAADFIYRVLLLDPLDPQPGDANPRVTLVFPL